MPLVVTDHGKRHQRAGADEVHRHQHAVVQLARGFGLHDHGLLLACRCQQRVDELEVVGDLGAQVAAREVAEVTLQGRSRLDRVCVHVARCVR